MHRFKNPILAQLAIAACAIGATMLAKKDEPAPPESTVKEKPADEENPPVRTSPHMGVQGPESGPSGNVVVDATSKPPAADAPLAAEDKQLAKLQAAAQKAAEDTESARTVRVRAKQRGYIGLKIREADDVFLLQLDKGEALPRWVEVVPDENVATTPISHSSEAKPEVVGDDGIGKKVDSNDVL